MMIFAFLELAFAHLSQSPNRRLSLTITNQVQQEIRDKDRIMFVLLLASPEETNPKVFECRRAHAKPPLLPRQRP